MTLMASQIPGAVGCGFKVLSPGFQDSQSFLPCSPLHNHFQSNHLVGTLLSAPDAKECFSSSFDGSLYIKSL